MSELINNSKQRKEIFKKMILKLHSGVDPEKVKKELKSLLNTIPSGEVVEVEQELIESGEISELEIVKLCDLHSAVLEGSIDSTTFESVEPGHPVDTFRKENVEIKKLTLALVEDAFMFFSKEEKEEKAFYKLKGQLQLLMDIDKHYRRKENLLFPYLEKYEIYGPAKVMWGKQDEIRAKLKETLKLFENFEKFASSKEESMKTLTALTNAVEDMIFKEEEILLPMALGKLTVTEWFEIYEQTQEIGYCIFVPTDEFKPEGIDLTNVKQVDSDRIQLPSGSMTKEELVTMINTLPIDITFVDKDDKVRYFSQGDHRIFDRNKAILGRDVRFCHPPSSVNVVEQIVDDFKSGKADHAPFWIQMHGKFIHIEYFALRNEEGDYLGVVEMSQELSKLRSLKGEQRILNYQAHQEIEENSDVKSNLSWLNENTMIAEVLEKFPFLVDKMETISEAYVNLKNPVIRKTMAKIASIKKVAKNGNLTPQELIDKLKELIKKND